MAAPVLPETVREVAEIPPAVQPPAVPEPIDGVATFHRAQDLEREGRHGDALQAYQAAAEAGHGPAQRRLGSLYGSGAEAVQRDYAKSVHWYGRARENGESVPEPHTYVIPPVGR